MPPGGGVCAWVGLPDADPGGVRRGRTPAPLAYDHTFDMTEISLWLAVLLNSHE